MYVLRISMCQMLCWTNQTWPCILEAYSIVENVNIIYLIITVIIAIQEKLRTPRSGASRNPDLSRWLLGSLSLHFWNGQRRGGHVADDWAKNWKWGDSWQTYGGVYLTVWTYMEQGSLVYSTWWRGNLKISFQWCFCTRPLLTGKCRGRNLGSSEFTLQFSLHFANLFWYCQVKLFLHCYD